MKLDPTAFLAEPDLLSVLRKHAIPVECRADTELFHQGDEPAGLYILLGGDATMVLENSRLLQVVKVPVAPGALLGLPALISDRPYSMSAIAKAGAQVGFVTRSSFSALMLSEPSLALMVLRVLAGEVHSARSALADRKTPPPHRARALRRKMPLRQLSPQQQSE